MKVLELENHFAAISNIWFGRSKWMLNLGTGWGGISMRIYIFKDDHQDCLL